MPEYPIKLGKSGPCEPCMAEKSPSMYYPSIHLEGDKELDFPSEGTMKIRFKKVASTESERGGDKHYSCTLDVTEILDTKADKSAKEEKSTGEILDDYVKGEKDES